MSAPEIAADQVAKTCEVCGNAFTRKIGSESRTRFAGRRYCGRECMGAARRTTPAKPKANEPQPIAAAPRIENGVWRPNAPGWPAAPRIPAQLQRST